MEYQLTKEDYQILETLAKITSEMLETLNEMATLEKNGKKETSIYQSMLKKLETLYHSESMIYEKIGKNLNCMEAMIEFMSDESLYKDLFDVLIEADDNHIIRRRMVEKLDHLWPIEEAIEELNITETCLGGKSSRNLFHFLISDLEVNESIRDDNCACFLSILKKYIDLASGIEKESLLRIKYKLPLLNDRVFEDLLRDNFEIPSIVYLRSIYVGEEKKFISKEVENKKRVISNEIMVEQMHQLLSFNNEVMKSPFNKAIALIHISILRMSLLNFSEEEVEQFREAYEKRIRSSDYLSRNSNNSQIEKEIRKAYQNSKEDKSIPITIRFVK